MIRMNIYRFFTTKSLYVILAITFGMMFLITKEEMREPDPVEEALMQEYAAQEEDTVGINLTATGMGHEAGDEIYRQALASGLVAMMCGIFAAIYAGGERGKGFLKNLNCCARDKVNIFLAKSIPILLLSILEMGAIFLAVGCNLPFEDPTSLLTYTMIQILLHTAFGAGILAAAEIVRSQTITLIFAIFTSMGVGAVLIGIVENMLAGIGIPAVVLPGRFMVVTQIRTAADFDPVMIVAACIIMALYLAAGVLASQKRDLY